MKTPNWLKQHLVDANAVSSIYNPAFSVIETVAVGMSAETSLHARMVGTISAFCGMGTAYAKGQDLSRRIFNITEETKKVHDPLYGLAFNAALGPAFYFAAGSRDLKEIALGTLGGMAFGIVSGWPIGFSIDTFRDLMGIEESKRLSESIKKQSKKTKLGIAVAATLALNTFMFGVYAVTPNKNHKHPREQILIQGSIDDAVQSKQSVPSP